MAAASAPPSASTPHSLAGDRAPRQAAHRRRPGPRTRAGLMSRNRITVTASPEAVFDVLDDADAYPRWVVGARRVRRGGARRPRGGRGGPHPPRAPWAEKDEPPGGAGGGAAP